MTTQALRLVLPFGGLGLLLALLLLEGCEGRLVKTPDSIGGRPDPTVVRQNPDIAIESGQMRSVTGCLFDYSIYRTPGETAPVAVVLAHGFLRDRGHMDGLARGLSAAGLPTATIDLCNMSPWDGAHRENAADMRMVADRLGVPRPLYAGFSAGGLAALLAADGDPDSIGVLALDLVDQAGMGQRAAAALERPIIGLFGDASGCNADNNGLAVMAVAGQSQVIRVPGATHCDFEAPTDGLCRLVCEPGSRSSLEAVETRKRIIDEAVRAARRLIGLDGMVKKAQTFD
jgi:pimeloyl-ACP methyl ester carboxylesterase